jgi:hypothetical protein
MAGVKESKRAGSMEVYGQKVISSPLDRLKPPPAEAASRYQNWKFQVESAVMSLAGALVKSRGREASPNKSA